MACNIALDAVRTVAKDQGDRKEIDIKNYAKVEKVGNLHYCVPFDCANQTGLLCGIISEIPGRNSAQDPNRFLTGSCRILARIM